MSFRVCIVLSIALLPVRPTTAQHGDKDDPSWLYRTWTVEDGLPSNVVQAALHTSDEFLWLGTLAGLVRFDGQQFTVFDKSNVPGWKSDVVYDLLEDDRGILWASSLGGLVRYDAAAVNDSSAFRVYTEEDGLRSSRTKALARTADGTLWVGSYSGGLSAIHGDMVVGTFGLDDGLLSEAIWTLETQRDGGLYIGTDAGVGRYKDGVFTPYVVRPALPDEAVRSLYEDPDGRLWVGTNQGGITLVEDGEVVGGVTADDLGTNNAVSAIREAPDGTVWVATTGGLSLLSDDTWSRIPLEAAGLADPFVWDIHFGPRGIRWASTDMGGLIQLQRPLLEVVTQAEGLSDDNLYTVLDDREGRMWFGTRTSGVQFRLPDPHAPIRRLEEIQNGSVTDLFEDQAGRIWVATVGNGLVRLSDEQVEWHATTANGLSNDFVRAIAEDHSGTIWVGTNDGISLVNGDTVWAASFNGSLPSPMVVSLHSDRSGRMWIGTVGGLAYTDDDLSSVQVWEGVLGNEVILSLHESDDGTVWVGTRDAGLAKIAGDTVTTYGRADGLLTDEVHAVLDDGDGSLWISSMRGIYRVARADLDAIDRGAIDHFRSHYLDRSDGLPSLSGNRAYGSPATRLRDGRLAFATDAGAVLLDPTTFDHSSVDVPVRLQAFLVNGRPVDLAAGIPLQTRDRLEMHFTALNYAAPQKTQYRYRLDGLDADWMSAGRRTVAFYNNLPPGSYTFLLDATNAYNQWRAEPLAIRFRVAAPWHRSWWAYGALGLVVLGTLVPATRYLSYRRLKRAVRRLDAERRVQQERERISRDLHDNVGAQLSNLISGIELVTLHTNAGAVDDAARCLNTLEGEARSSIRQLRETIWALHHEEVVVDHLRNQIHSFVETQTRYRDRPNVRCIVERGGDRTLSSIQALHLFRIAQEAIHNSLKYADADLLQIRLIATEREVTLSVEDDGSFKQPGEGENGEARFGLDGIYHRAGELGGSASITTRQGTHVHVSIPFNPQKIP